MRITFTKTIKILEKLYWQEEYLIGSFFLNFETRKNKKNQVQYDRINVVGGN